MPSTSSAVTGRDGTSLFVRHWPAKGQAWASMVIVHGLAEHSGRYERTAVLFAAASIDVTAQDLHGHGSSGGERGHVDAWSVFLDDVEDSLGRAREATTGRPVVLLGHSMGGLICADYATSDRPLPDLLVLSTPALADRSPGWQHTAAPILSRVSPRQSIANPWGPDALSRDPEVGRAVAADPLCLTETTVRLGAEMFAAQRRATAAADGITIPTLVIHGEADPLVPLSASEPLVKSPSVERRTYPELRHETLNEPEGPDIVGDIIAWLRDRAAAGGDG